MMTISLYALLGLVLGMAMMIVMRALAPHLGLVDAPGGRKTHGEEVPLVGGVAIFLALCGSMVFMPTIPDERAWFVIAGGILVGMGVLDDRYPIRASFRILGQVGATLIMVFGAGLVIRSIGNPFFFGEITTGMLAVPFTVLVAVTVINAFNLTDGMDGLAASLSLISLLPFLVLVVIAGRWPQVRFMAALIGVITAFLLFNFPASWNRGARTFMGDAGSTFLGLAMVWVGLSISQGEGALVSPVAGLWFIAIPVHDLLASAVRRARKRQAFWTADLGHAHHIFLRAGFTPLQALLFILAVASVYCLIGLSGPLLGIPDGILFTLWVLAGIGHIWLVRRAWVFSKILEIMRTEL